MLLNPEAYAAWRAECCKADIESRGFHDELFSDKSEVHHRLTKPKRAKMSREEKLKKQCENSKRYRDNNKELLNAKQRKRYANLAVKPKHKAVYRDPDYQKKYVAEHRAEFNAYQKEYKRRARANKKSATRLVSE